MSEQDHIRELEIFSPATIANISCGFDVLGCCLEAIGDTMRIRRTEEKGIRIRQITGEELPLDPKKNVAGAAIEALLHACQEEPAFGIELDIHKRIKPGSGIGSSAASAAGAVFGVNELLGRPFSLDELIQFAAEGERLACGAPIADNVAPALLGGFTLVQNNEPLRVLQLPSPQGLYATIVHPQIEIKTADARAILPEKIALTDAVRQWANVGALVHALHENDLELFSDSLHDFIVEPHRSKLIPRFDEVKKSALQNGALGCGISGSGPSIYAFSKNKEIADYLSVIFYDIYNKTDIRFHVYVSAINPTGIKTIHKIP